MLLTILIVVCSTSYVPAATVWSFMSMERTTLLSSWIGILLSCMEWLPSRQNLTMLTESLSSKVPADTT